MPLAAAISISADGGTGMTTCVENHISVSAISVALFYHTHNI